MISKPTHPDALLVLFQVQVQAQARRHGSAPAKAARTDPAAPLLTALALTPGQRLENGQLIEALKDAVEHYTAAALAVRMVRLRPLRRSVGFEGATLRATRLEGYPLCVPTVVV